MIRPQPHPHVPPGMPGWAWDWAEARELSIMHPERWPAFRRAEYEFLTGETVPTRSPYRVPCPCHLTRLGLPPDDKAEPWRTMPGATMGARCVAWLRKEFGR